MPFDIFKRKEKKEKETKEEVPVNEELNDVKAKPEEEQKPTPEVGGHFCLFHNFDQTARETASAFKIPSVPGELLNWLVLSK